MPAPDSLDTSIPGWRRQFRGITTCKGATCGAQIGWTIHIDEKGRERPVPYNETDGHIHYSTCPDVESFKRKREGLPQSQDPAETKTPPKPKAEQQSMFGSTSTTYLD